MLELSLYPRYAEPRLLEALGESPVVLIHGPRQCGKTTLAQSVGTKLGYQYLSFDDGALLAAATGDPMGFVADLPQRVVLDEVQRVPELFSALKLFVDRERTPGRFLLTGSSNVLLLPRLSDSLAGRMEIFRLHPLAQTEVEKGTRGFLSGFLERRFRMRSYRRLGRELAERISRGGYPAAFTRQTERRRTRWYRDFMDTIVQRDVRGLARIRSLEALPRLLLLAASQTSRLLNIADLAAPFQLSRPTIGDYVSLLSGVFLLETLPAWHSNRLSRLVKKPKMHLGDTGIACTLLGLTADDLMADRALLGQLAESFVFQELNRQASWQEDAVQFFHFRDKDDFEVDIVIEQGARQIVGVEVKSAASVGPKDFRGLRKLREATGSRFAGGIVFYDGEASLSFGDDLFAVPIRALWDPA